MALALEGRDPSSTCVVNRQDAVVLSLRDKNAGLAYAGCGRDKTR